VRGVLTGATAGAGQGSSDAAAVETAPARNPAGGMVDAQLAEIRRLRGLLEQKRITIAGLRREIRLLRPLRRRQQREQAKRWAQHERAELWKHRALRK